MAANFPGPYGVQIFYTVSGLQHSLELNTNVPGAVPAPGSDPLDIDLVQKDGGNVNIQDAVEVLVSKIAVLYSTTVTFSEYILWKYQDNSFERDFITVGELLIVGTNANPPALAKYRKFTLRSANGGVGYLSLLECIVDGDTFTAYPATSAATKAIANELTDANTCWLARDNGFFIYCPGVWDGQNEKTYKQRYR